MCIRDRSAASPGGAARARHGPSRAGPAPTPRAAPGRRVRPGVGRDERGLRGEPVRLPERDPPPDAEIPGGLVRIEDDAVIPRLPAEDQRSVGQVPERPLPGEPEREMWPGEMEEAHRSMGGACLLYTSP